MGGQANPEKVWVDTNRPVVERAYAVFIETGQWPKVSELRRHFARLNQGVDVEEVVRSEPPFPGEMRQAYREHLTLRFRHLRYVWQTAPHLVTLCLAITRRAVAAYLSDAAEPRVSNDDLELIGLAGADLRLLLRAGQVLQAEWPGPLGGGGSGPDQWFYLPNDALITKFRGVTNADDFVARQREIGQANAHEMAKYYGGSALVLDDSSAVIPPSGTTARPTNIFVVMAFRQAWSDSVYDMIKRVAAGLEIVPSLKVERADEIKRPGRITDQIMNAINNADVLIAEVSDQNPNVMFELGYAYAFGKVVILMTQDVSKSPFDILGDRQLIYAEHPTNADEDELRKWLLTALSSDAD
jgi:hypothetical protein